MQRFARALRVERAKAGMTQAELAKAVEVAPTTISGYETLQRTDTPDPDFVYQLEDALGVKDGALAMAAGYLPRPGRQALALEIDKDLIAVRPEDGALELPPGLDDESLALLKFMADVLAARRKT